MASNLNLLIGLCAAGLAIIAYFIMRAVAAHLIEPVVTGDVGNRSSQSWDQSSWRPMLPLIRHSAEFYEGMKATTLGEEVRRKLAVLGNPLGLTVPEFFAITQFCMLGMGLICGLLGLGLFKLAGASLAIPAALGIIGALVGLILPYYYLSNDAATRTRAINKDLPYALDLILLIIEGGSNIQEAFAMVSLEGSYGPLAEELRLINSEVAHGETLSQALNAMGERIPSDDLKIIIQAITQGIRLGTPIAQILRDQSDLLRLKRTQRAEKIAKQAASKMVFPLLLIVMATFLLIMAPAIIKIVEGNL